MLQIRKMTGADAKTVLPMVYGFYRSDAVDHAVPEETLNRTFQAAVTDGSLLEGFVLEDETGAVGFAYLSPYYACEVGGVNMMLEAAADHYLTVEDAVTVGTLVLELLRPAEARREI